MESELFEEMFAPGLASAFYAHEFILYFKMGSSKNFYLDLFFSSRKDSFCRNAS